MSNVSVGWDETAPADSAGAGFGALAFRSLKSNIRGGLSQEHFWPSSDGNAGAHKKGSARVYVGSASQVSSADTDGRLMWDSSNSRLMYLDSTKTAYIGGQRDLSVASATPALAAGQQFVTSLWSVTQATWPTGPISLPQPYASIPYVFASLATSGVQNFSSAKSSVYVQVTSVDQSSCVVTVFDHNFLASTDTATVNIMAIGIAAI